MRSYIKNGEVRIPLNSGTWTEYREFLNQRLERLKAKKEEIELELKGVEEDIAEVLEILNPEKNESPEETFISLQELSKKINIEGCRISFTCEHNKIPCHRINEAWVFSKTDIEQIKSMMSRGLQWDDPNDPTIGALTSKQVCDVLGVTYNQCVYLREKGLLNGKSVDGKTGRGSALYFKESEVNALLDMIKADGGYETFMENLRTVKEVKHENIETC